MTTILCKRSSHSAGTILYSDHFPSINENLPTKSMPILILYSWLLPRSCQRSDGVKYKKQTKPPPHGIDRMKWVQIQCEMSSVWIICFRKIIEAKIKHKPFVWLGWNERCRTRRITTVNQETFSFKSYIRYDQDSWISVSTSRGWTALSLVSVSTSWWWSVLLSGTLSPPPRRTTSKGINGRLTE